VSLACSAKGPDGISTTGMLASSLRYLVSAQIPNP